jgi:hypothetical protein
MFSNLSRSVSLITLSLLISPLSPFQASARWLTEDEADIECVDAKVTCHIMKDGSWTAEDETHLRALTEAGREALALQTFTYDAARSSLNILEARVSNEGEADHVVSKEQMEDKELASDLMGLSNNRQVLVPFGHVGIGSIVHLKTRLSEKSLFKGYFAKNVTFDEVFLNQLVRNKEIHIESEIPLFYKVNDPRQVLEIRESKDEHSQKQILDIKLKKTLLEETVDESKDSYDASSLFTSVSLSTETDYSRIKKFEADLYRSVLSEQLPEKLEKIRQQASEIKDEVACMDTVVSSLITKLKYLGSWNTEMGGWAPLSLEKSMATGKVDCKGFASCFAAILNKIEGYKANISLVQRGNIYNYVNLLPSEENFNHVIVKVIAPSGKTYWVDPTNAVSMAGGIFPDIADRPVHVLDLENPTDEHIPAIDYHRAQTMAEQIITIEGRNRHVKGSYSATAEAAIPLIQGLTHRKFDPVSTIKTSFNVADPINPMGAVLKPATLSNIVEPVKIDYIFGQNHFMSRTTKGCSYPLDYNWALPYIMASQEDVGGLYVSPPSTSTTKLLFKGQSVPQAELDTLAFSIETPCLTVKRDLTNTPKGVLVMEKVETLKSTISAEERKSKEFINLQNRLREDYANVSIVFSDNPTKSL